MTPNILFRNCRVWDECVPSVVQYEQGMYTETGQNPDCGNVQTADGIYLNVSDGGVYSTSKTPQTFFPDYENGVLVFTTSFKYKNKIPYKSIS